MPFRAQPQVAANAPMRQDHHHEMKLSRTSLSHHLWREKCRGPSTTQSNSLRESPCSAQDDNLGGFYLGNSEDNFLDLLAYSNEKRFPRADKDGQLLDQVPIDMHCFFFDLAPCFCGGRNKTSFAN